MVIKMFLNYFRTNKAYNLASHLCDACSSPEASHGTTFQACAARCMLSCSYIGQLVYSNPMFKYIPKIKVILH